jgi:hypothetical protein
MKHKKKIVLVFTSLCIFFIYKKIAFASTFPFSFSPEAFSFSPESFAFTTQSVLVKKENLQQINKKITIKHKIIFFSTNILLWILSRK